MFTNSAMPSKILAMLSNISFSIELTKFSNVLKDFSNALKDFSNALKDFRYALKDFSNAIDIKSSLIRKSRFNVPLIKNKLCLKEYGYKSIFKAFLRVKI